MDCWRLPLTETVILALCGPETAAWFTKPLGLVLIAPGKNIVKAMILRLTSGIFSIARVSSVVASIGVSVFSRGTTSASTDTFCCALDNPIFTSTFAIWAVSEANGP